MAGSSNRLWIALIVSPWWRRDGRSSTPTTFRSFATLSHLDCPSTTTARSSSPESTSFSTGSPRSRANEHALRERRNDAHEHGDEQVTVQSLWSPLRNSLTRNSPARTSRGEHENAIARDRVRSRLHGRRSKSPPMAARLGRMHDSSSRIFTCRVGKPAHRYGCLHARARSLQ